MENFERNFENVLEKYQKKYKLILSTFAPYL